MLNTKNLTILSTLLTSCICLFAYRERRKFSGITQLYYKSGGVCIYGTSFATPSFVFTTGGYGIQASIVTSKGKALLLYATSACSAASVVHFHLSD